jgi:hypothetical protein
MKHIFIYNVNQVFVKLKATSQQYKTVSNCMNTTGKIFRAPALELEPRRPLFRQRVQDETLHAVTGFGKAHDKS